MQSWPLCRPEVLVKACFGSSWGILAGIPCTWQVFEGGGAQVVPISSYQRIQGQTGHDNQSHSLQGKLVATSYPRSKLQDPQPCRMSID